MRNSLILAVQKQKRQFSDEPKLKRARPDHKAHDAPITDPKKFLQQLGEKSGAGIAAQLSRCPKCLWGLKSHDVKQCTSTIPPTRIRWAKKFLVDGNAVPKKTFTVTILRRNRDLHIQVRCEIEILLRICCLQPFSLYSKTLIVACIFLKCLIN
jgi:hypothetical protein